MCPSSTSPATRRTTRRPSPCRARLSAIWRTHPSAALWLQERAPHDLALRFRRHGHSALANRLNRVNLAHAVLRHVTEADFNELLTQIAAALGVRCADAGGAELEAAPREERAPPCDVRPMADSASRLDTCVAGTSMADRAQTFEHKAGRHDALHKLRDDRRLRQRASPGPTRALCALPSGPGHAGFPPLPGAHGPGAVQLADALESGHDISLGARLEVAPDAFYDEPI